MLTPTLRHLRDRLEDDQRAVLNAIWRKGQRGDEWPLTRELHRDLGTSSVRHALNGLSGSIVFDVPEGDRSRYQLTLLGVLLTDEVAECVSALAGYLRHIRHAFLNNPLVERITSEEVEAALQLTPIKSAKLGRLIHVAGLWSGSARLGGPPWEFGVPREIDDLPEIADLESFVVQRALDGYDPELPVWHAERMRTLVARGDHGKVATVVPYDSLVPDAIAALHEREMTGAARRLEEAFEDLRRRPQPDLIGAVDHSLAALESVMRSLVGDDRPRFSELVRKHGPRLQLREPLGTALDKLWGFASDTCRHGKEGAVVSPAEAEVAVVVVTATIRFLLSDANSSA